MTGHHHSQPAGGPSAGRIERTLGRTPHLKIAFKISAFLKFGIQVVGTSHELKNLR
jgi:hypothetical protein